jgi:hypothetical protein
MRRNHEIAQLAAELALIAGVGACSIFLSDAMGEQLIAGAVGTAIGVLLAFVVRLLWEKIRR